MPGPCKFPSLDSCQKRFLWTHKEVDLAPHPVTGLVHQEEDAEKFLQTLGFEGLDPFLFFLFFFGAIKQDPCFTAVEDLYSLNLLVKLTVLYHQILFSLAAVSYTRLTLPTRRTV